MLKKINQVLELVGFNLVHAKKAKAKITVKRSHYTSCVVKSGDPRARTVAECTPSPDCCQDEYNAGNAGRTHFVGDGCKPAHVDASPTQDNNITGPTA